MNKGGLLSSDYESHYINKEEKFCVARFPDVLDVDCVQSNALHTVCNALLKNLALS